ncbi:MAG: CcmD family protein [Chloroflexi bacterium]|nr:CcmD family protein [Chloroflexota bacterium]MCL5076041.1 CcmD family protein [Chloroflexota bacterium]
MQDLSYLFAAYTIIWLAIFTYMLSLAWRERDLRREIEALKKILEDKSEAGTRV